MTFNLDGKVFEIDEHGRVYLSGTNDLVFFRKGGQWRIALSMEVTREDWIELLDELYAQVQSR